MATLRLGIDASGSKDGATVYTSSINKIKSESRSAVNDVNKVSGSFDKMKASVFGAGNLLRTFGIGFSVTALIGGLHAATENLKHFKSGLAEVSTLLDDTSSLDEYGDKALELAKTYGSMPVDQVKSFYNIISAGATDAASATSTLDAANKLAVGGVTDINNAVDGLTSTLNAYQLQGDAAIEVSDAFFVAMRAGKTTVGELSSSIGLSATIAASAGVSYEELLASVAALTTGGIRTTVAMNEVRRVIAAVLKPAGEAEEVAKALGIQFDAVTLKAKGLAGFLKYVGDAAGGNITTLAKLFGSVEALNAVLSLTGTQAETFNDILDKMETRAGQTDIAVSKMADDLQFQSDRMAASATVLGIKIGELFEKFQLSADRTLADSFDYLANNLDTVVKIVEGAAVVIGARLTSALLLSAGGFVKQQIAAIAAAGQVVINTEVTLAQARAAVAVAAAMEVGAARTAALASAAAAATAAHNAHAAALQRVNLGARAASASMTVLNGILKFFGGWIGVAITAAAGALYYFSQGADEAADKTETLVQKVDRLTSSVKDLHRAELEETASQIRNEMDKVGIEIDKRNQKLSRIARNADASVLKGQINDLKELGTEYGKWATQLERIQVELDKLNAAQDELTDPNGGGGGGGTVSKFTELSKSLDIQIRQSQDLVVALQHGGDAYKYVAAQIEAENKLIQEGEKYSKAEVDTLAKKILLNDKLLDTVTAANKEREEAKKYDKSLKDLQAENALLVKQIDAYGKSAEAIKEVNLEIAIQNALKSENIKAGDEQTKQMEEAIREHERLKQSLSEVQTAYKAAGDGTAEIFKKAAGGIYDAFSSTFREIFDKGISGFDDFADKILNVFKDMLAQMATLAIAKPIIVPVVQQLGGILGLSGSDISSVTGQLGGGASAGSSLAGAGSVANLLSGPLASILGIGALGGGLIGNFTGGNTLGGSLGGAAGAYGGVLLGSGSLGAVTGALTSALGTLGNFVIPGLGLILGGFLGSKLGGGGPSNKSAWGALDLSTGDTSKFGNMTGSKFSQETVDARDSFFQAIGQFSSALQEVTGGIISGTVSADIGLRDGTQVGGTLLGTRRFADPQSALNAIFDTMVDRIQGVGNEWRAVLDKLDLSDMEQALLDLNDAASIINKEYVKKEPVNAAAKAMQDLNDTFKALADRAHTLGLSTVGIYNELQKQQTQLRTDFNQSISEQILAIVDPMQAALNEFDKVAAERIANAKALGVQLTEVERLNLLQRNQIIAQYQTQAEQTISQANASIINYLAELTSGQSSPYNSQIVYGNAQARFADLVAQAASGNEDARSAIVSAANNFLAASKEQNGATVNFFEDLSLVTDALYQLANDGTGTSSLLRSIGTAITRGDAEIISNLEQMRELIDTLTATVAEQQTTIDRLLTA